MSGASRHILAIDLGTSGPKVALVREDGELLGRGFERTKLYLTKDGGAEQDPAEWWRSIVDACRQALSEPASRSVVPDAICCTGQWSGTVALDEDGKPLMNAIVWIDARGAKWLPPVIGGLPTVMGYNVPKLMRWVRVTGGAPERSGKGPIAHILFLRHERPEIYARTRCFLEPTDYLNALLTGVVAASTDSIALHWVTDNRRLDRVGYDPTLLRWVGIERDRLPPLKLASEVVGELLPGPARELGLPAGIPVVSGTPDVTSAAIGSGAVADFAMHTYVGTSAWSSCHLGTKRTDVRHNIASLPSALPMRYFVAAAQESGGICLDRMADLLFFQERGRAQLTPSEERLERMESAALEAAPGSAGLLFLPWLSGERSPVEEHRLRGGFVHQSLATSPAEMIRAVYEGVAYNARWLFEHIEAFIGRSAEVVNMIGGGAQSALWCQIYSSVLDRPIQQMKDPIWANIRGAAMLGLLALGACRVDEISDRIPVERVYEPVASERSVYAERFDGFLAAFEAQRRALGRRASQRERGEA